MASPTRNFICPKNFQKGESGARSQESEWLRLPEISFVQKTFKKGSQEPGVRSQNGFACQKFLLSKKLSWVSAFS